MYSMCSCSRTFLISVDTYTCIISSMPATCEPALLFPLFIVRGTDLSPFSLSLSSLWFGVIII